jgi:excisionase family DNA binding protein
MTLTVTEHTTLPPQASKDFSALLRIVDAPDRQPPLLVGPNGEQTQLPDEVYEVLTHVVRVMAAGKAVTVAPHNLLLTTQEAADLLGVSRPTIVRLLERGDIPFTRPNRHRRVQLIEVLEFQRRASAERQAALRTLVEISEDLGLYDNEDEPPLRRGRA